MPTGTYGGVRGVVKPPLLDFERGDLLAKTKIKIIRCYDGTRPAGEILNEAIALKVRKKLNDDIENIKRKEYNLDNTQVKKHP